MKGISILIALFAIIISCTPKKKVSADERIMVYEKNPHYFAYKGEPVLLLGGSDEDNLFNNPELMMNNLNLLKKIGGNYIRCTMSSRESGNVWPFAKTKDGLYDLNTFNPEYWHRFENCLREAATRNIIVQIEVWATFDFCGDSWLANPFNPKNNINYSTRDTKLQTAWPYHPASKQQPFVFSIPPKNNDKQVLKYQQKFVDKLTSISFEYGNALYCMDNETRAPAEWAWYWGNYILQKAKEAGVKVLLTEMWDAHDLHNEEHKRTYDHPELFSFVNISQNNWQEGQIHYDNALWIRKAVQEHGGARPLTNIKVYQRRQCGKPNDPAIDLDRWWQNIFAGCAGTRFHRPSGGTGLGELSQKAIRAARIFTNAFNIFSCDPHTELLSKREENEAYCLANPGKEYAVYFPRGGKVVLAIDNPNLRMQANWFNPETDEFLDAENIMNETFVELVSPDTLQTWLALVENF